MRRSGAIAIVSLAAAGGCTTNADLDVVGDDTSRCAGYAASFDGSAYLSLTTRVQDDFTLEAWIRLSSSLSGNAFYHGNGLIYADAPAGPMPDGANDFGSSILNQKFAFGIGNPDTTLQSTSDVATGRWVHVAATRSIGTGELEVIVNGSLEGSVITINRAPLADQPEMMLGNTLAHHFYTGLMDEVRIWSVVRSAADIAATMHRTLGGNEPGLVAYLKFDDPGGIVATDSSPSKLDATVSGPLEWVPSDAPVCNRP